MLNLTIPPQRLFNNETSKFFDVPGCELQLEHSLISVKKWEGRWHKAFLSPQPKTDEEVRDYIRCMTINKNVPKIIYNYLPNDIMRIIAAYIDDPMSATVIYDPRPEGKGIVKKEITAELVYYWMITLNIPVEFEKWHFNQLMTLIRLVQKKQPKSPKSKHHGGGHASSRQAAQQRAQLNAQRRAMYNTNG